MRWVIGDIHGMRAALEALLGAVARRDPAAELYFTGDFCDRGPDTRGVVDLLLALPRANLIRGNHDDVMDLCCNGQSFTTGTELGADTTAETVAEVKELFLREGLTETLVSYGADLHELGRRVGDWPGVLAWVDEGLALVPELHKRFFRELPAIGEADDFFVCHATWPADQLDEPGRMNGAVAGDVHLRRDVLWGRYVANQIRSKKVWRRTGYFGHTPTDNYLGNPDLIAEGGGRIIRGERCVLIDTGVFAPGGRLSAVCHDDGTVIQVSAAGEVLGGD